MAEGNLVGSQLDWVFIIDPPPWGTALQPRSALYH